MEKHPAVTVAPVVPVTGRPMDYDPWMSAHDIAAMFGKSVRTILRWADEDRDFPESFYVGRDRRWRQSEILAYRKIVQSRRKPLTRAEKRDAQLAAAERRRQGN